MPDVLATALDAHAHGLCVIRARTDGTKAPLGEWKRYQTERPDADQLTAWFANGHTGIGIVCGEISGNIEMLELEGVAVVGGVSKQLVRLAKAAGIEHVVKRLVNGYYECTPSDGVHWVYRVEGAPVAGNTKLARRLATEAELATDPDTTIKTLIETRGEGGFVVIAPSHGTTHPTGKPWTLKHGSIATIPTLTATERDALFDVCRQIDTLGDHLVSVEPVAPTQRITVPPTKRLDTPASWMDATCEHLAAIPWSTLLNAYGWTYERTDRHGADLWCRPGKTEGVSAWVARDRLNVFSSSTPLDSSDRHTCDRLDLIAAYEHRGDRQSAARAVAEMAGIRSPQRTTAITPANVDPDTGEIIAGTLGANLPDDFWTARPCFEHIRQAAHSRGRCADAVLLTTMARIVTLVPPMLTIPAIVSSKASLNLYGAIVGPSGTGKSAAIDIGCELVPIERKDIIERMQPGSGEGIIEAYLGMIDETDDDGKKTKVKRQVKTAAFATVDEGQSLMSLGERSGSTTMGTLRSAWVGTTLGQANASAETNRYLAAHRYRLALIVGFQLRYAATLMADAEGGTPQRFAFVSATDPHVPDDLPDWPGPLDVDIPPTIAGGSHIGVDGAIAADIKRRSLAVQRGQITVNPLDSHADLVRLKVAAIFAIMDGRLFVDNDDWGLAERFMRTSNVIRSTAIEVARKEAERSADARLEARIVADRKAAEAAGNQMLERGGKALARKVHKLKNPAIRRDLHAAVASRDRDAVSLDDMIEYAIARGWIEATSDGWIPTDSRPS